jgi:hypothetical protein
MTTANNINNIDLQNVINPNMMIGHHINQKINEALIKEFRSLTSKFNIKNLITIIFLMGLDNFKIYINKLFINIPEYFSKLFNYFYNKYFYKNDELILNFPINNFEYNGSLYNNILNIYINYNLESLLLEYILNNKHNVTFNQDIIKYEVLSKNKFSYLSELYNISILYNNFKINIIDRFNITYHKFENNLLYVDKKQSKSSKNYKFIYKFVSILKLSIKQSDYITTELTEFLDTIFIHNKDNNININDSLKRLVNGNTGLDKIRILLIPMNENNEMKILNGYYNHILINSGIENDIIQIILIMMTSFFTLFFIYGKNSEKDYSSQTCAFNYLTDSIYCYKIKSQKFTSIYNADVNNNIKEIFKKIFCNRSEVTDIYNKIFKNQGNTPNDRINLFKSFYTNSNLNITIFENDILQNEIRSNQIFEEFVNYLYEMTHKNESNENINVFNINIKYNETTIQEYIPSKIIEKKLDDDSIERCIIPETFAETHKIVSAELIKINSIYKDFSSLYLKEKDEFKLKNMLNTFDKKKDLYKKLGLPFKFSCLLYGSPGTGKTSAVKSIASFLRRDIYYLDISKVKTNDELTKIFSDITENTKDCGVIVMEDIDAMSKIVLERTLYNNINDDNTNNHGTNDDTNDKLTLSHLLNILDGTLTKSDMVFIATTNHLNKLDSALKRPGRFDIIINLSECDRYQFAVIYKHIIGKPLSDKTLDKLSNYTITPAKFIYTLVPYIGSDINDEDEIINVVISSIDQ